MQVIASTWAFKLKRFPDGLLRKLKSRFCVRGDLQKKIEDEAFDTFAPVVSWNTVRILLILSVILELETKQVDYVNAFCQAPLTKPVYIQPPAGWRKLNRMGLSGDYTFKEDHVLKLTRSLYGMADSPKNFFEHLKSNLEKVGFKQSNLDPCLFISDKVICLTYVDDCLFFAKDGNDIDEVINGIQQTGMALTKEDSVAGFLGVLMDHSPDTGHVTLTQTGLIDRIITATGLEGANLKHAPAPEATLPRDLGGQPFDASFNYASVVGMLMYLANNSRPDISFAVHQCARHTHNPTRMHGEYLKHIVKYLKGTRTKGLILNPTGSLHIDCMVDADFAGLWNREDDQDPHCVKSRTGFVILLGGCPVIWTSKLQTEIAMSTMEAEYIALSTACRDLIPLRDLVLEIATAVKVDIDKTATIKTTIHEDNVGALTLANMELPRMTPRSKHIAVKYHWFREHIQPGVIDVVKIDTNDQLGDIFTKGLGCVKFKTMREKLLGW